MTQLPETNSSHPPHSIQRNAAQAFAFPAISTDSAVMGAHVSAAADDSANRRRHIEAPKGSVLAGESIDAVWGAYSQGMTKPECAEHAGREGKSAKIGGIFEVVIPTIIPVLPSSCGSCFCKCLLLGILQKLERVKGIEPSLRAKWFMVV